TATTSQIRVRLDLTLRLTLAGLGLVNVTVPYYFDAGDASASLDTLHCGGGPSPTSVDIWGSTTQGRASLGFVSDAALGTKATIPSPVPGPPIFNLLNTVTISQNNAVTATVAGNSGVMRTFSPPYTSTSASQQVPGTGVALPALTASNLTVGLGVLGLSLNTNAIKLDVVNGVTAAVGPTAAGLTPTKTNLVDPVFRALGLGLGGADLWAPPPQKCTPASFFNPTAPASSLGGPVLLK
ncbi:MAG TPA: hypothetical protein VF711_12965, partial [Acidimicrobiales bacterium]